MFSDSDRSQQRKGGGEEGRTKGVSFRGTRGLLFGEKQVGWVVMREDSWQVQRRLTAKRRWQRGITEELSWGSLCDIFVDSFLVVGSFFGGVKLGSFVLERLQKINIGFNASKSTFWISSWTFLCQRFGYFTWEIYAFFVFLSLLFLTGLKWTELTWQKLSHTVYLFLHQLGSSNISIKVWRQLSPPLQHCQSNSIKPHSHIAGEAD